MEKYTFYELIDIFPEAKPYVKKKLIKEIKDCKNDLSHAAKLKTEYQKVLSRIYKDREFWERVVDIVYIEPWTEGREKKIKQNTFYLQSMVNKDEWHQVNNETITNEDIQRAKMVPITNFIEFNKAGFAKCIYHQEKTPSLKYYPKNNTCYCFGGCIKTYDVIDIIKKLNNCDFISAVKFLK